MLNSRRTDGASLIELSIVVLLVAIIVAVTLPSMQGFIANQRIKTVAESLRAGLQLARAEALKRNAAVFFDMSSLDSSWTLGCETPDPNDADGDGLADCPTQIRVEASSVSGGTAAITIVATGGTRATFSSLGLVRSQNQDGSAPLTRIDVTAPGVDPGQLRPQRVLLPTGGLSRVCDPSVTTAGDTRKC